ncbi:class I SAM-dependent methyltransferase [Leucobacter iarius]|uniref:LicD family protein n=1 Tax=Leucobacter iarius TaxID=333963 RepID=A0ABP4XFL4_9MICO
MPFTATPRGLTLPDLTDDVRSVDVCFGEQRVWSIDLLDRGEAPTQALPWPAVLRPHLAGHTEVVLRRSGDGGELGRASVSFSEHPHETRVVDAEGIPLAINKWGRLGKTLEAGNVGVQERILDRTEEVVAHLVEMGLRPFVVGGTLLGGVREGALLPHDDDADVAYLSEFTNPADVAREGFAVGHRLQRLGYELVRHSATHMQLYFRSDSGSVDHYVDVFTAFFTDDGNINQPFHVRGPLREDQMLPFGTVSIAGRDFPTPADPDAWLVINYDENWRTPIPGYHLGTPRSTSRRFQSWFGSYHFKRDFWNEFYEGTAEAGDPDARWAAHGEWILRQNASLTAPVLLELGAGSGALSARLRAQRPAAGREPGRRVIASDYSTYALAVERARAEQTAEADRFEVAHLNLLRTLSLDVFRRLGATGAVDIVANHVLEQINQPARANALRLIRMALRSGGSAVATVHGQHAPDVSFDDPTTWHLSTFDLAREAKALGLGVEFESLGDVPDEPDRRSYGARFTLAETHLPQKEISMKQRLKRLAMRARPSGTRAELDALTERVHELENELDEYRRDSLRVAELLDLAEQRLTPGDAQASGAGSVPAADRDHEPKAGE